MTSSKIKTIIIEDHPESQFFLTKILNNNFESIDIIGFADTVHDAKKLINAKAPELVFMDIELKDGSAFDILDQNISNNFEVIFVTAFDDYIKKAIEHFAFSYIIKPYTEDKLIASVQHYIDLQERLFSNKKLELLSSFLTTKNPTFLIQVGNEHVSVTLDEIVTCVANGNYTCFNLIDGKKHLASRTLKHYEELLKNKGVFKAHRSILVNIKHIASIYKKETLILKNKDKIHVSIRNKPRLAELINLLS